MECSYGGYDCGDFHKHSQQRWNQRCKNQRGKCTVSGTTGIPLKKNKNVEDMESHTVHYGNIYNGEELIDEVLMVVMKAPNTYTREDVVEIDCHGGILVTKRYWKLCFLRERALQSRGNLQKEPF